jgi:hypothetical protein
MFRKAIVLLSLLVCTPVYAQMAQPSVTVEADVLTSDSVSDGSTTSWFNVLGYKTLTFEWTLADAEATSLTLTTTCQECKDKIGTCSAADVYDLSAMTITSGAATINVPSWIKAATTTTRWAWAMATNYQWVRCTTTSSGSPHPAIKLSAHVRKMAQ